LGNYQRRLDRNALTSAHKHTGVHFNHTRQCTQWMAAQANGVTHGIASMQP